MVNLKQLLLLGAFIIGIKILRTKNYRISLDTYAQSAHKRYDNRTTTKCRILAEEELEASSLYTLGVVVVI